MPASRPRAVKRLRAAPVYEDGGSLISCRTPRCGRMHWSGSCPGSFRSAWGYALSSDCWRAIPWRHWPSNCPCDSCWVAARLFQSTDDDLLCSKDGLSSSTYPRAAPCPLFQVGPSVAGEVLTPINHHPAILFSEICDSSRDPQIACYNFSFGAAERWQSGRMYLTRNQAYVQTYRGFESLPLRHSIEN